MSIEPASFAREEGRWRFQWSPIFVGALIATALSSIMVTFGATLGLGVSSASPSWRDASVALWVLSGLFLILQSLISFGWAAIWPVVPARVQGLEHEEVERFDGFHGIAAWALAVVIGAFLTAMVATAANRPSTLTTPPSATEPSALSYEIDTLFRTDPDLRMVGKPGPHRRSLAIWKQGYDPPPLQIAHDCPVATVLAEGPVVNAGDDQGLRSPATSSPNNPQQGVIAHRQHQSPGEARRRSAAECQPRWWTMHSSRAVLRARVGRTSSPNRSEKSAADNAAPHKRTAA